jgi:hypothetical protein
MDEKFQLQNLNVVNSYDTLKIKLREIQEENDRK